MLGNYTTHQHGYQIAQKNIYCLMKLKSERWQQISNRIKKNLKKWRSLFQEVVIAKMLSPVKRIGVNLIIRFNVKVP